MGGVSATDTASVSPDFAMDTSRMHSAMSTPRPTSAAAAFFLEIFVVTMNIKEYPRSPACGELVTGVLYEGVCGDRTLTYGEMDDEAQGDGLRSAD